MKIGRQVYVEENVLLLGDGLKRKNRMKRVRLSSKRFMSSHQPVLPFQSIASLNQPTVKLTVKPTQLMN